MGVKPGRNVCGPNLEVTCVFVRPIEVTYTLIFMALFIFEMESLIRSIQRTVYTEKV
jgi:hypothetical protein